MTDSTEGKTNTPAAMTPERIAELRKLVERHARAMGPGGEKAWIAGLVAAAAPELLAEVERLRCNVTSGRLTSAISADLRDLATGQPDGPSLLTEAADQLDELITLLAKTETDRDFWRDARDADTWERLTRERDEARDRAERYRVELRDAHNDLLDVRGILSPADAVEPVTPLPLVPTVAPAVRWLVNELEIAEKHIERGNDETMRAWSVVRSLQAEIKQMREPTSNEPAAEWVGQPQVSGIEPLAGCGGAFSRNGGQWHRCSLDAGHEGAHVTGAGETWTNGSVPIKPPTPPAKPTTSEE